MSIRVKPIIKKLIVNFWFWYWYDVGNSSVSDIFNMIPAIKENNMPNIRLFMYGKSISDVIMAPNGSDNADTKV